MAPMLEKPMASSKGSPNGSKGVGLDSKEEEIGLVLLSDRQLPNKTGYDVDVEAPHRLGDNKRKRTTRTNARPTIASNPEPPYPAATDEEKMEWQGFCEIESDPAFFNIMLKEFGVRGAKIQEVFGLDEEMLCFLPKPVYGLIFLFQYSEGDAGEQEDACPDHVWFANQVTGNACATVALLNMVNNVPGLELGERLEQFKSFTRPFPPAIRGVQVAHFDFVKHIHNSFARKIDMLNIDAFQEEEFEEAKKRKRAKRQSKKASTDDSAFHFVAYVPIQDYIWKLDGLDSNPQKFGACGTDNWLELVTPVLSARMAECEDGQLQFSLLALVRDPLIEAREILCKNIDHLARIDGRLNSLQSDWPSIAEADSETLLYKPNDTYGITKQLLAAATAECGPAYIAKLEKHDDITALIQMRQGMATDQGALRATVRAEMRSNEMDEEKAMDRRNDYGPFIQNWMGILAENLELKDLVADARK